MEEHHAPERIEPKRLGDYLEVMSKAVFFAGMNWGVVEKKWPGTQEAFHRFEPMAVASITGPEMEALQKDTRVIRNARKLDAVVYNAQRLIELEEKHKGFRNYLRSHGGFEGTVKDMRKQFKFIGETGCFYFLWCVSEEVPEYEDWCKSRGHTPYPHDR